MRKTVVYLLLLILCASGVWYFLFRDKNIFGNSEAGFTVKDTASIDRIFMADKTGNTILLQRNKEGGWLLNNKYPAMSSPVNTLLNTLTMQVPMYPVPETMHNNIVATMAATAIKVELYNKDNENITTFYVGGQANNFDGTYMLMEGAERPYVVQIPGLEGYLTSRYSTDAKDWRDRTICNIPPSELSSVSITYPAESLNSFTLTKDKAGKITVKVDSAIMNHNQFNERRAKVFSKYFEKVYHEGYVNGALHMDSIISTSPVRCIIDVASVKGQKQHIEVHWMPLNKRSKNMLTPNPTTPEAYDADRFFAIINNAADTVIIQRTTFDKIFRRGYEFYQPDDTSVNRIEVGQGAGNVIKMHSGG